MKEVAKVMEAGITLNRYEDITAYVLLHGNTGCLCAIVEEGGREIYENKAFTTNGKAIRKMRKELRTMIREIRRGRRWQKDITAMG